MYNGCFSAIRQSKKVIVTFLLAREQCSLFLPGDNKGGYGCDTGQDDQYVKSGRQAIKIADPAEDRRRDPSDADAHTHGDPGGETDMPWYKALACRYYRTETKLQRETHRDQQYE